MDRVGLDALAAGMAGRDAEHVFSDLRARGKSPVEAIYVASRALGLSLGQAKAALFESAAWRGRHDDWQRLHDEVAKGSLQQ